MQPNTKFRFLASRNQNEEEMRVMPGADYVIRDTDHLMVMAGNEVAERILEENRKRFVK